MQLSVWAGFRDRPAPSPSRPLPNRAAPPRRARSRGPVLHQRLELVAGCATEHVLHQAHATCDQPRVSAPGARPIGSWSRMTSVMPTNILAIGYFATLGWAEMPIEIHMKIGVAETRASARRSTRPPHRGRRDTRLNDQAASASTAVCWRHNGFRRHGRSSPAHHSPPRAHRRGRGMHGPRPPPAVRDLHRAARLRHRLALLRRARTQDAPGRRQ